MGKKYQQVYDDYETYVRLLQKEKPSVIVGFDETGNGAIAGPLCVAGCALPVDYQGKLKDSKHYSENARKKVYEELNENALLTKSFMAMPSMIEEAGHGPALYELYRVALLFFYQKYGNDALYILDGNQLVKTSEIEHHCLIKGDAFVPAISGASIIAKVERDYMMTHTSIPEWGFEQHKGYPTVDHLSRLQDLGPIQGLHRMNIDRVRKAQAERGWFASETVG